MESYSSDFAFKGVVVVNNTNSNSLKSHKKCRKLCGHTCSKISVNASEKAKKFFSRFYKFRQMDFEYAIWQMVNIFAAPQKLYRNFSYHNSTRNQWARDDPAFMILLIPWIFIFTVIHSAILHHSFWGFVSLFMWSSLVEFILSGFLVATFMWVIANNWMVRLEHYGGGSGATSAPSYLHRRHLSTASDDESVTSDSSHGHVPDVEWAYALDVHLNALFPCMIILRVIQPIFFYFIRNPTLVGSLVGNTFWLAGVLYYVYITFLGYKALPFLRHTRAILITGTAFVIIYIVSIVMRWNFTMMICHFYVLI